MFTIGKYIKTLAARIRNLDRQSPTFSISEQIQSKNTPPDATNCTNDSLGSKEDVRTCSLSVDFESINAFSIDRIEMAGKMQTAIGFWVEDVHDRPGVRTWFLACSPETHERLVQEFNIYKEKKHTPKICRTIW